MIDNYCLLTDAHQIPLVPVPPQAVVQVAVVPTVHQAPPVVQPVEASSIETAYFTLSHLRVFQSGTIDFMQVSTTAYVGETGLSHCSKSTYMG